MKHRWQLMRRLPKAGDIVRTRPKFDNLLVLEEPRREPNPLAPYYKMQVLHIATNHVREAGFNQNSDGSYPYFLVTSTDENT